MLTNGFFFRYVRWKQYAKKYKENVSKDIHNYDAVGFTVSSEVRALRQLKTKREVKDSKNLISQESYCT